MFQKILIANRGEIACRIMRTATRMGIATVAVYSEPDRRAQHVLQADEAVCIGAAAAAESYLMIDRIVQACRQTGAQAVHPGYGFLSENPGFVTALEAAGITFIGPGRRAIEAMGDKITAKRLAEKAGVSVIAGHTEAIGDAAEAVAIADAIGYPVMLKASAGGGGKGMRVAHDAAQCAQGFERATGEASASFGDGRIFIEKYVQQPRHIEIQVLADAHGNVITLNERECSIQRRHQKIIEEAPSPCVDPALRRAMSRQAEALARAVDYCSAGTVEFIVDERLDFYFLEMNTRLQVEHPVTEMITGLDLVELMIRIAAGEALPLRQDEVPINGWALESRIYAENPRRNFVPSTGRLVQYQPPPTDATVRLDGGVQAGDTVSLFYDPMIAKLITWGRSREQAIDAMRQALDQYYIRGIETNQPLLARIIAHRRFRRGELTVQFIDDLYPDGFCEQSPPAGTRQLMAAVAVSVHDRLARRAASGADRALDRGAVTRRWVARIGEHECAAEVVSEPGRLMVKIDRQAFLIEGKWSATRPVFRARINAQPVSMQLERVGWYYQLCYAGWQTPVRVMRPDAARMQRLMPVHPPPDRSAFLLSPMPGLLLSLPVTAGQQVKAGEVLAVVEAMKMENALLAEQDAVIARVLVKQGDIVEADQPVLEFAAEVEAADVEAAEVKADA